MNLIGTNDPINMSCDYFVSSNNSFKVHLNGKGSNMFLTVV